MNMDKHEMLAFSAICVYLCSSVVSVHF